MIQAYCLRTVSPLPHTAEDLGREMDLLPDDDPRLSLGPPCLSLPYLPRPSTPGKVTQVHLT